MSTGKKEVNLNTMGCAASWDATGANASREPLAQENQFVIHVYSRHPLAMHAIEQAICSDSKLARRIEPLPCDPRKMTGTVSRIVVLDTFMVEDWAKLLQAWRSCGCRVIGLFGFEMDAARQSFEILSCGASGIVDIGQNLADELPKAISAVAQSKLWINSDTLEEYVRQTSTVMHRLLYCDDLYTERERQIVNVLVRGYSNKEIASALAISERTVKFHVSNILQKSQIETRKELIRKLYSKEAASADLSHIASRRAG